MPRLVAIWRAMNLLRRREAGGRRIAPPAAAPDPVLGTVVPHSHAAASASVPEAEVVAVCDLVRELVDGFRGFQVGRGQRFVRQDQWNGSRRLNEPLAGSLVGNRTISRIAPLPAPPATDFWAQPPGTLSLDRLRRG